MYRDNALNDLYHPVVSHFYGTIAIALLVLAVDFIVVFHNLWFAEVFWSIGTILTILFSILIPYVMFIQEKIEPEKITPAWYIPPVGLIVIPMAGSIIMANTIGVLREIMITINYFCWGAGFLLYVALYAICMYRYITHQLPPARIAPTIWINLGPVGAGTASLYSLTINSYFISCKEPLLITGFFLWGLGLWWLVMAILITLHYIRNISLPYSLAWWAFIFPLGAYVSATHSIASTLSIGIVDYIGLTLYFLLLGIWIVTVLKTLKHLTLRKFNKEPFYR